MTHSRSQNVTREVLWQLFCDSTPKNTLKRRAALLRSIAPFSEVAGQRIYCDQGNFFSYHCVSVCCGLANDLTRTDTVDVACAVYVYVIFITLRVYLYILHFFNKWAETEWRGWRNKGCARRLVGLAGAFNERKTRSCIFARKSSFSNYDDGDNGAFGGIGEKRRQQRVRCWRGQRRRQWLRNGVVASSSQNGVRGRNSLHGWLAWTAIRIKRIAYCARNCFRLVTAVCMMWKPTKKAKDTLS